MNNGMYCPKHPKTKLRWICPRCEGKKGGQETAKKHADKMAYWGALGGRPKKSVKTK